MCCASIMASPSINFNQFLEKEKLKSNGSNFTDWFRHVRIFLNGGNLQYVLDAPLGSTPPPVVSEEEKNVFEARAKVYSQVQCAILCSLEAELQKRFEHHDPCDMMRELKVIFETHAAVESYEASKQFFGCMMEEGSSVSEHMFAMSGHARKLSDLGIVIPNQLVLMVNKTTKFKKQGKPKKDLKKGGKKAAAPPEKPKGGPKPDTDCYYCNGKGHWKRNCPKYLADLKSGLVKKKKGISDIHVIDVYLTGSRTSAWSSAVPEDVPVPPAPVIEEANDNDHETLSEVATEPRRSTRERTTPDWYDPCLNLMIVDNNDEDPATYEEAMMSPDSNKWQEAMKSEMGSMYDNKVWTLVDLPDSRKAVENKWIFKRKQMLMVFGERSGTTTGSTTSSSNDEFLHTDNFLPDLSDFFDNLNMGDNDAAVKYVILSFLFQFLQINSSSVAAATRPPLFDGMHYKRWRTKAVLWFTNLGYFSATDARPEGPLSAEEQEKFEKVDAMFKAALFSILGDNIVDPYMAFDHGKDAWDALEAKFGVSDAGTELYVMEQYYDYRMTDERSVVEQAHEIQSLAKELEQFKCTLPDKFGAGGIISKLPPSWRNFVTSLKHKRQEFSVSDLIGSLHVEEKVRAKDTRARSFEGGSSANVVHKKNFQSHKSKNKNNGKGKFDEKNKASNSTNFKRKTPYKKKGNCHVCGAPGHWAPDCPERHDRRGNSGKSANVVIGVDTEMKDVGNPTKEIFSELDEINAQDLIFPGSFQKAREAPEGSPGAPPHKAARPRGAPAYGGPPPGSSEAASSPI
ncbi:hypothetical protein QYE76_013683 [Lolium multiflorum]|uniref:CCHC-type domain-containing protein n=1 Tax=Lolium multiflorum TaxID=4521 RepID=A0AAD8U179_LOLMU|nr:hypothetical protein QYE76_013683 [Lolium multiflorum]